MPKTLKNGDCYTQEAVEKRWKTVEKSALVTINKVLFKGTERKMWKKLSTFSIGCFCGLKQAFR